MDISNFITTYDVVVPPDIIPEDYYRVSVEDYDCVLNSGNVKPTDIKLQELYTYTISKCREQLSPFTDKQLIELFGIYPVYSSRHELVDTLIDRLCLQGFFIPLKRTSSNEETLLFHPTSDQSILMIAYGTVFEYRLYEIDELYLSFHPEETPDGPIIFRRPESPLRIWNDTDILDLYRLLSFFIELPSQRGTQESRLSQIQKIIPIQASPQKLMSECTQLMTRIRQGLIRDFEMRPIITKFQDLSFDIQKQIFIWLHTLFYTGLYMRRWKGPNHPYPLRSEQTQSDDVPDLEVSHGLLLMESQRSALPPDGKTFVKELKLVRYYTGKPLGKYIVTSVYLDRILEKILDEEECIRMASTDIIVTANYYLDLLYMAPISDLDLNQLDHIS